MSFEINPILLSILFGIVPATIWLFFWLREDRRRPEPRGRIFATFVAGMISVFIVIPIEKFISSGVVSVELLTVGIIVGWAFAEEFLKYLAAYVTALRSKIVDEPIDPIIYLITSALGFAAMENILFILGPLREGLFLEGFITGNMRFVGATLLHVVASGTIGIALSFSFYRNKVIKKEYFFIGLILATLLHALFNFFIIKSTGIGVFIVFAVVWLLAIMIILLFEKIKQIRRKI